MPLTQVPCFSSVYSTEGSDYHKEMPLALVMRQGTALNSLHILTHLVLATALRGGYCDHPHLTGEETETERLNNQPELTGQGTEKSGWNSVWLWGPMLSSTNFKFSARSIGASCAVPCLPSARTC